jgi:hypothetical protein
MAVDGYRPLDLDPAVVNACVRSSGGRRRRAAVLSPARPDLGFQGTV